MSGFFSTISRLRWIQRWSLKRNTLKENVMEHSWEVGVIAHLLGCINNKLFDGTVNPDRLSTLALYHDCAEAITGDLPTPIKYYSSDIEKAYKAIEKDAENSLVAMLPQELQESLRPFVCGGSGVSEIERKLLKAADNLSAYIKAKAELANGNAEYIKTVNDLEHDIKNHEMPEVGYFIAMFIQKPESVDLSKEDYSIGYDNLDVAELGLESNGVHYRDIIRKLRTA